MTTGRLPCKPAFTSLITSLLVSAIVSLIYDWETLGAGLIVGLFSGGIAMLVIGAVLNRKYLLWPAVLAIGVTEAYLLLVYFSPEGRDVAVLLQWVMLVCVASGVTAGMLRAGKQKNVAEQREPEMSQTSTPEDHRSQ